MIRNQIHTRSLQHRPRKLSVLGQSRAFESRADTQMRAEQMKMERAWAGGEILVPITFDAASEHAFDAAIDMAKAMGAGVLLVHVTSRNYGEGFLESGQRKEIQSEVVEASEERLAQLTHAKRNTNVPIRSIVKTGLPAYEILRLAETEDVTAIFLGRSPRNIVSRMLCGTVSRDIIDCAPCPVMVMNTFGRARAK
jgi:nucleotide-binding universal stress UspA family protein